MLQMAIKQYMFIVRIKNSVVLSVCIQIMYSTKINVCYINVQVILYFIF